MGTMDFTLIRAYVLPFSSRETCYIFYLCSFSTRSLTKVRQHTIHSSLASQPPQIWSTTSCESLLTSTFSIERARDKLRLVIIASYLDSLFEARKPNQIAYPICFPLEDCKRISFPNLDALDNPSILRIHHCTIISFIYTV